MTTSPTLPGILFVWTSADPEHERDFNRWYDREHVEERVRIPGFVSGTRYQSVRGPRKYLGPPRASRSRWALSRRPTTSRLSASRRHGR